MLVFALFFLPLVCPCHGFPEQGTGTAATKHVSARKAPIPTLFKQEPLEELLNRQEAKWASMLKEQEAKWASWLKNEKAGWASLLNEREMKWASAIKEQVSRLTSQLRQQEEKLLAQQDLLRLQAQRLSYQESLLQEQAAKLSSLQQQENSTIQQLKHGHFPHQTLVAKKNLGHFTNTSVQRAKTSGFTSHDVITRSDDAGPLEAVVSQLSQRVTEMGADVQAFKTQTSGDLQTLKNSQTQQDLAIHDAQSSTFVHWGSSTCTNLSHAVYSGVVGGSHQTQTGAATNYLCLTMSPVFSDQALPSSRAYLYGGEYETDDSHEDKDPVCAVCRSTLSTTVMIPGTNVCTPGWHLQYSGFLMAGYYNHAAGSEFICVDTKMENFPRSDASEDGKLLYYTVTQCGSLPCTPYVNNKVVTCAVCSK